MRVCHKSMAHPLLYYLLHNPRSIVALFQKGKSYYNIVCKFYFPDLLYYKQAGSSQRTLKDYPDDKNKIEFYRFIPKYFFKLNPFRTILDP